LSAGKGVNDLLEAFAILESDEALVYVGGGEENALRQTVVSLGLQDRVHFTGFQINPYPWIRHAKLLVLPSSEEAMGYVLMEAAALGCGVVATDFPAAYEFLVEDVIVPGLPAANFTERLAARISQGLSGKLPLGISPGILESMASEAVARQYLALGTTQTAPSTKRKKREP
jgi:glycosyltransferase involved in cell wall biosynthesis